MDSRITLDLAKYGRFYAIMLLLFLWFVVPVILPKIVAMSKVIWEKVKESQRIKKKAGESGWILAVIAAILLWPGGPLSPAPSPTPDVGPGPVVARDDLDTAWESYRILLADAVSEFSRKTFAGDDQAIEFLENRLTASQEAAFEPFNSRLARAAKDGQAASIADQIKSRKVKLKE